MRMVVAGAGGVVGRMLVPVLVARGHEVAGIVRSPESGECVAALGAEAVVVDALDPAAMMDAFRRLRPEVVIHQLTALSSLADLRDFDGAFRQTNRLRTEGTDILLAAAREIGARRFVAQSFCGWPYARSGGPVKSEDDPLDPNPPTALKRTLEAIRHLERSVTAVSPSMNGVVLRYGAFYGPGTQIGPDGAMVEEVRRRRVPIIGAGGGVWSFIHIADAASAAVAAAEGKATGIFNVVDDEPAPVRDWLPALAEAIDAKPPFRVPAILARLALPEHLVVMMTQARGGANARFKAAFDWKPEFASWREGFRQEGRRCAGVSQTLQESTWS